MCGTVTVSGKGCRAELLPPCASAAPGGAQDKDSAAPVCMTQPEILLTDTEQVLFWQKLLSFL